MYVICDCMENDLSVGLSISPISHQHTNSCQLLQRQEEEGEEGEYDESYVSLLL